MGAKSNKNKRAFTIWELLFLIFIIFLLFGLLMPSLSKVRSRSTEIICKSTLRFYGNAGNSFLKDNDDYFPDPNEWLYTSSSISDVHPIGCRWHDKEFADTIIKEKKEYQGPVWKYFEAKNYWCCPIFYNIGRLRGCENTEHNSNIEIDPQYSYTMNAYLGGSQKGSVQKSNEVRDPTKVFFFAEENSWTLRPDHPKYKADWLTSPLSTKALDNTSLFISATSEAVDCFATYHRPGYDLNQGYGNVVFIDGHVDSVNAMDQLRKTKYTSRSKLGRTGNLLWAWPSTTPPAGGLDE